MNDYYAYLMDKPSVPRQPYCPVCGRAAPLTEHHIVARSQGGEYGPTVYLCGDGVSGCHGLAEAEMLHFDYVELSDEWLYLLLDEPTKYEHTVLHKGWKPLHLYDPVRDAEPVYPEEAAAVAIASVKRAWLDVNYHEFAYCRMLADLEHHFPSRAEFVEAVADMLDIAPSAAGSYVKKRLAWASLPVDAAPLGVTHGYRVYQASQTAPFEEVLRDWQTMPRLQFEQTYPRRKR